MDSPLIAAAVLHSGRRPIRRERLVRESWSSRLGRLIARCIAWART